MKARLDRKTKILTAAVFCACTTLWASSVWAASGGSPTNGAYYGGRNTSASGKVEGKNVTIGVEDSFKGVYGGYAFGNDTSGWTTLPLLTGSAEANNNKVIINGGTVTGEQIMGDSRDRIYGSIVGGWSNYASGNKVIIQDITFEVGYQPQTSVLQSGIYGALVMVSDNEDEVGGANSENYDDRIYNNKVEIKSGNIKGTNIAGVYVDSDGEYHNKNLIKGNSVIIDNATIEKGEDYRGNIYGAYSNDINNKLINNSVTINSGTIITNNSDRQYGLGIFGACANGHAIMDDPEQDIDSEDYDSDGVNENDFVGSSVENNTVTINGGKITGAIYGAYAWAASDKDTLINNKVVITGGEIIGDVYAIESRNIEGFIKNNGIEISGNTANLSQANLHGIRTTGSKNIEGQYLLADNYQGSIKSIDNFDILNISNSDIQTGYINLETTKQNF